MDVSSKQVIDAVAEKIKYYMDIKRREDGFDLSGSNEPKRRYPRLKTAAMMDNGKLHDRSLKHYFSPNMIRTQIANLEAIPPGTPRQKTVKKTIQHSVHSPRNKNDSFMDNELHSAQLEALSLLESGARRRIKSRVYQSTPILRKASPTKISKHEVNRLINRSSQILVATETVALAHEIIATRHHGRPQSAPATHGAHRGFPGLSANTLPPRPGTARGRVGTRPRSSASDKRRPRYAWDINGRRVPYRDRIDEDLEDYGSSSYSASSSSIEYDHENRRLFSTPKHHPRKPHRPASARHAQPSYNQSGFYNRPYSAGGPRQIDYLRSEAGYRHMVSPDSGLSVNAGTQTRRRPDDHRRMRGRHVIVVPSGSSEDGAAAADEGSRRRFRKYKVTIRTGDRLGAGTGADIYLSLHGSRSETDEMYLTRPLTPGSEGQLASAFRRGKLDVFEIETEDVGELRKIGIGHDQKDKGFSWYLDEVVVSCGREQWRFECDSWLSGSYGDKRTFKFINLTAHSNAAKAKRRSSHSSGSETTVMSDGKASKRGGHLSDKGNRQTKAKSGSSSSSSQASSRSSSSEREERRGRADGGKSPPAVRPSDDVITNRSDVTSEVKSHLEYSSDSSAGRARRQRRDSESYVEDSDDSGSSASSTSDSRTLEGSSSESDSQEDEREDTRLENTVLRSPASSSSDSDGNISKKKESVLREVPPPVASFKDDSESSSSSSESEKSTRNAFSLFATDKRAPNQRASSHSDSDRSTGKKPSYFPKQDPRPASPVRERSESSSSSSESEKSSKNPISFFTEKFASKESERTPLGSPRSADSDEGVGKEKETQLFAASPVRARSDSSSSAKSEKSNKNPFSSFAEKFAPRKSDDESSSSSSSSGSDLEEEPPRRTARLPSFAESVTLQKPESTGDVTRPEVTYESASVVVTPQPVVAQSEVREHEVLVAPPQEEEQRSSSERRGSSSSSSSESSSSDEEAGKISESFQGDVGLPPEIAETEQAAEVTFAAVQKSEAAIHDEGAMVDSQKLDKIGSPARHGSKSSSSSSESSSSEEEAGEKSGFAQVLGKPEVDDETPKQPAEATFYVQENERTIPEKPQEDDVFQTPRPQTPIKRSSSRSRSSSSSSSSASEDEEEARAESDEDKWSPPRAPTPINEEALQEESEEKAQVFMDGFNAGIQATRKLSHTDPTLLDHDVREGHTSSSSWQPATSANAALMEENEEDGVVRSPRQLVVRMDVHDLVKDDQTDKVKEVVSARRELMEKENEKGWRPIHVAAANGRTEILQWLGAMGAHLEAETPTGYTAMHMAAMHGHKQCMMVIHALGASLETANVDGQTALHLACMSDHLEAVKWLVANQANLRARDNFHRTPLDLAKQYRHKAVVQFLRECLRELKKENSSFSLLQSSKSSFASSSHYSSDSSSSSSSSSSNDEGSKESDAERKNSLNDETETSHSETYEKRQQHELEERKQIYQQQQERIKTRRTSFLDAIRAETEESLITPTS